MSLAIETHQLTRFFGDFCAVNGIALRVERGTFYGFLGPNGAGKSTTIKMLTGLLAPSKGEIRVLGRYAANPHEALEVKSRVGVVPEDLALLDNLTAREYLTFVGRMYLLPRDTIRQRIDELLPLLDLAGEEKKLAVEYSHGMKKKLSLAAALLPNPDLLFLDEPFEGVDAVTSRIIRDLLAGYVARGSTVFLTSHVLEIVEKLCTHVGIIVKGALVEQGALDVIRQGGSLEDRFLERAGADADTSRKLSWLEGAAPERPAPDTRITGEPELNESGRRSATEAFQPPTFPIRSHPEENPGP
jgi:ABC-2 type transport system ATP-binding protein